METELRHTLVQYQGGGYDGCIWEWNYFYIDHDGEFHDIQSSGRAGITTAEDADDLLANSINAMGDEFHAYNATDPADVAEFSRESNAVHVKGVLQWFNDNMNHPDIAFFAVCTDCGRHIDDADYAALEDWHGCGGIASTADALLCEDCYSVGTCHVCGDYVGAVDLHDYEQDVDDCSETVQAELEDWNDDHGPACQYCWEGERDGLIANEQADLLTASLATGTPDLFSEEMRWFWE